MLDTGTFLSDRYEIIEKIGSGGMSDVYHALDHVLERDVAVKVLKSEFSEDESFVKKFRAEALSAAGLEHPNIVNIYDVGSENGLHYIVMEYVEGITLKTYIEKKGRLNYKEVISIAIQAGRGIEAAHQKGIIHRDIKPQNIIISQDGRVKVTDFGIARAASSNTMNADVMGSVHYASPEQARNGYVTAQSDIYSLGIVMYEMTTGRVPYDGETAVQIAIQHLQGEMVPPSQLVSDVPVALEQIILKATQKSPDRRYPSMSDMLIDLKKALLTPDEDFITKINPDDNEKTRVITPEELDEIRDNTEAPEEAEAEPLPDEDDPDEDSDDDYDDDTKMNPKMEKAITIMGIAAAAIIAIIILYLAGSFMGWFHFGGSSSKNTDKKTEETKNSTKKDEKQITVPDLLGMTESEAKAALKKENLGVKVMGTESSDKYKEGQVSNQSPKKGKKVEKNSTIKLWISSGSGTTSVPDVTGQSEAAAKKALTGAGFEVNVEYSYDSAVAQGTVISQNPKGGQKAQPGDSITIVVSQGQELATVPSISEGASADSAKALLQGKGFKVNTVSEESDSVASGSAIRVNEAGKKLSAGSTVTLVISSGSGKVTVPSVSQGASLSDAESKIKSAGLLYTTVPENSETVPKGSVIRIKEAGTGASRGATVTIVVSSGPKEATKPTEPGDTDPGTGGDNSQNQQAN